MSSPWATAVRRLAEINSTALSAQASVIGVAAVDTYASIAWVSASMPVAAVRPLGMAAISEGSLTDNSGVTLRSTMAIFTCRTSSVMMQKRVISLAVPAVVLIAINGICGLAD
ncbi:hypothetical protein D3C84_1025650 [compost metagenome]